MKSTKNRRRKERYEVAVLVRCSIPKFSDEIFELEMWAKDVNADGLKLAMTRGLNVSRIHKSGSEADEQVRYEDIDFKKGTKIKVQDLFYDDDGSPFINGQVQWAKRVPGGGWELGVQLTDGKSKSKAVAGAFKDFLSIVKNPLDAIEKASRKK